jgi:hypothetical protein
MSDETTELKNEITRLQNQIQAKKEEEHGFGKYMELGAIYANVPHDPYSHQFQLIHRPGRTISKLEDMLDPNILLSNIEDSRTMFLCQRDFYFLSRFLDMGTRSDGILRVFNALFYPWVGQMRMTSALKGRERDLQSFLDVPAVASTGYGLSWAQKRHLKKQKKRKGVADYLVPQDTGGGGIYD